LRTFGRPRVLICDDEETIRVLCGRALTKAGYDAVLTSSGTDAVAAARKECFDVFILDVRMPEMDGPRVLSLLREQDPDTPCLIISGHADFDAAVGLIRSGANEFISKPFDMQAIIMAVDRVLASTHLKVDSALLAATQTIFSSLDASEIVRRVLRVVRSLLKAQAAAVFLREPAAAYRLDPGSDVVQTTDGPTPVPPALSRLHEMRDPALLSREVPGDAELIDSLSPGAEGVIAQRLAVGDRVLGVLSAARDRGEKEFGESDMRRAMLLAGHVALALENARLHAAVEDQARQLEQALDRLVVAERVATVGRLATGIGHEVSNPACAVLAHLEIAGEQLRAGQTADVDDALRRATAGARAILDVCAALRPLAGANPRHLVDLRQVLESALLLASYELRGRAKVVLDLPPKMAPIVGDPAKLGQVFLNLLLNAAQAMDHHHPDNEIRISAASTARDMLITFSDTGRGVPAAMVPRLFEPSVTTKTSGSGHGMGLAICRWIVEEMGGSIRCLPDVARGAVFEVRVPFRPLATATGLTSP
jgi:two-component system, NtrC family, sensor kinase